MHDNNYWQERLTPLQYHVTRERGTESPFTGQYNMHSQAGTYVCVCCAAKLFQSATKYESSCGWPSFFDSEFRSHITERRDTSHGMIRTEVLCAECGAHLGHLFPDGPPPTGIRYCINSASLNFIPAAE